MARERYNATVPPRGYGPDWLHQEFMSVQRAIPTTANPITYAMLPMGSGSWDTGTGTTITITRALTVTGAATFSSLVTANNGVKFGTAAASVIGGASNNAVDGLQLRAVTGSSYDFVIADPSANYIARVPTGTTSMDFLGNIKTAVTKFIGFTASTVMNAPSDGVLTLVNNAVTDFGRLQFGGTSSSFPALKRSTTALQARLADDSDYAPFAAKTYNVNGTAGASGTGTVISAITVVSGIVTAITVA